ncbi:hypothetical protein [Actinophytocola sp.]|uniref:hypothetical protein n=1 Tax=Actinophytocola sp. TaxID=1872138 RepID=UPI003D6C431D
MTERDDHLSEGFLVDGVAPSVIGGEDGPHPVGEDLDYEPPRRREPPTTPIPAQDRVPRGMRNPMQNPVQSQQTQGQTWGPERGQAQERKGWLGRMFGRE